MFAAFIGVAVEIEEQRFLRLAPDRLELLQIVSGIGVDVILVQLKYLLAIALCPSNQICLRHFNSCSRIGQRRLLL